MHNIKRTPGFGQPSFIPFDLIKFYYSVLAEFNYKKAIYTFIVVLCANGIFSIYASGTMVLIVGNTACLLLGIYAFFFEFFKTLPLHIRKSHEVGQLVLELKPYVSNTDQNDFYSLPVPARNETIIISSSVNKYLRETADRIQVFIDNEKEEEIKGKLRAKADLYRDILTCKYRESRRSGTMFFNAEKIALASDLFVGSRGIYCFKTSYFISYLTNELSTLDIEDHSCRDEPSICWSGIEHFPYRGKNGTIKVLKNIEDTILSNHIGGNTIAVSSNNRLCLWRQGTKNQRSTSLLAPTGSGSLDWSDYEKSNKSLLNMIVCGMERELHEESTKTGSPITKKIIDETKLLGYYRWSGKGGLPGFLAISKLLVSSGELQPNAAEVDIPQELDITYQAGSLKELTESVDKLLTTANLSTPLYVNLYCLKEVIEQDPAYLDFLFQN